MSKLKDIDLRGAEASLKTAACGYASTVHDPEEADQRDQAWEDLKKWALAYADEVRAAEPAGLEVQEFEVKIPADPVIATPRLVRDGAGLRVDAVVAWQTRVEVPSWFITGGPGEFSGQDLVGLAETNDFAIVHTKRTPALPERTKLLIDDKYGRFGIK